MTFAGKNLMSDERYVVPNPIVNAKENRSLKSLAERYQKMIEPGLMQKAGSQVLNLIPAPIKQFGESASQAVVQNQIYEQMMRVVGEGFAEVEKQTAKYTLSRSDVLKQVNKLDSEREYLSISELCLARSYTLNKLVDTAKNMNMGFAVAEGGAFGLVGFAGLPFSLVLNTFQCFRAVQNVAMLYGYDVQDDPAELEIAGVVFAQSLAPTRRNNIGGIGASVGKIMMMAEVGVVKVAAAKGWGAMAQQGGAALLIAQMRALANKAAANALEKAGRQGLEKNIFSKVMYLIGRKLPLRVVQKGIPIAGAILGASVDTWQVVQCIDYANIFYQKRFILEKKERVALLLGEEFVVIESEESVDES